MEMYSIPSPEAPMSDAKLLSDSDIILCNIQMYTAMAEFARVHSDRTREMLNDFLHSSNSKSAIWL
jgi:hypothetical protein